MGRIIRFFGVSPTARMRGFAVVLLALAAGFLALLTPAHAVHAATGINQQINYQGRLLDATGAIVADGTYNMEFKVYQDGTGCVSTGTSPCGGTLKWTETRTTTNRVTVRNGYFSVQLGEVTPFGTSVDWNQDTLWLSVNIGGTATTPVWDGEMLPFRRMAATPYALNAKQLGGVDASRYLQIAPSAVQADSSTTTSLFLNKTAAGNIMQLQRSGVDVFTMSNIGAITVQNNTDSTTALTVKNSVANGSHTVLNIDTTNERVGIGGVASFSKFEVIGGDAAIYNSGGNPRLILGDSTTAGQNGYLQWDSTNDYFRIETVGTNGLKIKDNYMALGNVFPGTNLVQFANGSSLLYSLDPNGASTQTTTTDSTSALTVKSHLNNNIFVIDTVNTRVGVGLGGANTPTLTNEGLEVKGSLRLSGGSLTYQDTYTTPQNHTVGTSINIVNYNPGAYGQLVAMGLPSTADVTSRALSVMDARAGAHQPSLAVLSQDENQIGGFSWDGSGTDFLVKNTASTGTIGLNINGTTSFQATTTGATSIGQMLMQSTTSATIPVAVIKGGATPGSNADLLQLQDSTSAVLAKFDNTGKFTTTKGVFINDTNDASAFVIQGASNPFVTVDTSASKFYVGNPSDCSGRFCVTNTLSGTGGSSYTNSYNSTLAAVTTASTFIGQNIVVNDTSTAVGNTIKGLVIDSSGSTNASVTNNLIIGKVASGAAGNLLQLQNGSTNVMKVTTGGATTVQTTTNAASAFAVQNAGGNAVLTVATNSTAASNLVTLGTATALNGQLVFANATNSNTITLVSGATSASYSLTLPTTGPSTSQCLQTDSVTASLLKFASCGAGGSTDLQGAYTNATSPATITTTDAKNIVFNMADTTTDSNFLVNLQCSTCSSNGGRFAVQDNGTDALSVSPSGNVGIGTGSASRLAHIYVNNATTTSLPLLVEQAGTGDTGLEFKTPSRSFYMGADQSAGGIFKLSSSTAAAGASTNVGYSQGPTDDSGNSGQIIAVKLPQYASAASVSSISVYVGNLTGPNKLAQFALYNDDGTGTKPTTLITSIGSQTLTANAWNTFTISASLAANTTYWAAFQVNDNGTHTPYLAGSGTTNYYNTTYGTWTGDLTSVTPNASTGLAYSVYITVTPTGGSYDNLNTGLLKITDTGQVTFQNSTNSTAAFQISKVDGTNMLSVDTANGYVQVGQANNFSVSNTSGVTALGVDTTAYNQNNLLVNTDVESSTNIGTSSDWQKRSGSETVLSRDTTQKFSGAGSLKVTTSALAGDGTKQNVTLTNGTTYTVNMYAKLDSASNSFATMQMGYSYNGTDVTTLVSPSYTVISNGWQRYSWTFKQTQTNSGTPYFFIKQTDATVHTFYVDGVTLQTDANADNNYRESQIQLNGTITSPVVLQNSANSSTAFQVQNASGSAIFTVDTTDTNLIGNPGAEVNTTGWSGKGSGTVIRDTSQQKFGYASFKVTATALANDGAQYTGLNLPVGTYSIGVSVKLSSGAFGAGTLVAGITNSGGDNNCTLSPSVTSTVPTTTGWTRFTCTVTIATTAGTAFYVKQTDAVARTYWFDGVELDSGSTLTPYGVGALSFNGIIRTPLTLQNQSDSTSALTLQNSAGVMLMNADTQNMTVNLGVTGSQATASTVNIASTTGNATQSVVIGATNAAGNNVTIRGGTGSTAIALQTGAGGTISIGTSASGIITLGSSASTGAITIGQSTATQIISIGNTAKAAGSTNTINIGATNNASTGTTAINIGASNSSTGATTIVLKGGTTATSGGVSTTLGTTASTAAVCSSLANATTATAGTAYELRDCSSTPAADFAEMYPVKDDADVGDLVSQSNEQANTYNWSAETGEVDWNSVKGGVSKLQKGAQPYSGNIFGVVSDNYLDFASTGYNIKKADNPKSVALVGRVNVKVTTENGPIAAGDFLTASATKPGYAMKATKAGYAVGQALSNFTGTEGQVMVFVRPGFFPGTLTAGTTDMQGGANIDQLALQKLTVSGTLTVTGNAVFHGLVSVNDIAIQGHVKVGKDTAGTVTIPAGQTSIDVTFERKYQSPPVVTTSAADFVPVKVSNKRPEGFSISIPAARPQDTQIDWIAVEAAQ